jgi:hypothetical protein
VTSGGRDGPRGEVGRTHAGRGRARRYARPVDARLCDDRGASGLSWVVDEPATRSSHALAADGRVWLVDPVEWQPGLDRALALGRPAAVLQLLDRHNRDCAAVARTLGVPHLTVPADLPGTPFDVVEIRRSRGWHEVALWWPEQRTLLVAEAIGTNDFFTGGRRAAGVHLLLRPFPPRRQLGMLEPAHLLVGHGEGLHGDDAARALRDALRTSRTGILGVVSRVPALLVDARRRRRTTSRGGTSS